MRADPRPNIFHDGIQRTPRGCRGARQRLLRRAHRDPFQERRLVPTEAANSALGFYDGRPRSRELM